MRKLAVLALVLVVFTLTPASYTQQALGRVEGLVADQTGAAIPGAELTLTNRDDGTASKTASDDVGRFVFGSVSPGRYAVSAFAAGFRQSLSRIRVKPGQTVSLAIVLEVGSVAETVERSSHRFRSTGPVQKDALLLNYGLSTPQEYEDYGLIEENSFHSVRQTPLSTFAADVDTASYSNVRRFLTEGNLPPQDAVRIEELINYFRYEGQDPDGQHPVRIDAEMARCPWNDETNLVRISVRTKAIDMAELPPINLTFLIDVSGSMQSADKLPLLKRSLALLAEQLRPQDRVAITVYAGAAGVVLPPTRGSERARFLGVLERLEAGGSTAGAAGIQLAYQTARESFRPQGINRVILATDGDFNVGVSSDSELVRMIEKERESGIFLSVLGFGTGNLKDAKMEQLADHGNGSYAYIDNLLEARRALVEQAGSSLATVAKDVKLQVEFNPYHVDFYRLVCYENRLLAAEDCNDDQKDAG